MKQIITLLAICTLFFNTNIFADNVSIQNIEENSDEIDFVEIAEIIDSVKKFDESVFEITEEALAICDENFDEKISFRKKGKKRFNPHWDGFGMGLNSFSDTQLNINKTDALKLEDWKSLEYNWNIFETAIPFANRRVALVTGLGLRWNRYHFTSNSHIKEIDGYTSMHDAPAGINYSKTKLGVNYITIPLLLEWHILKSRKSNANSKLFISAGVVGAIKYLSSSKVKYTNEGNKYSVKMDNGMNIRPITMDFLVQTGFRHFNVYARYSPISLFKKDKGPAINPVAIGLHLNF